MTLPFASWSVLTVDFLVVLHLALGGVTLAALLHLVNARWRFEIRYLSVSLFALFPLAFLPAAHSAVQWREDLSVGGVAGADAGLE
jgi:hypothetical protein